MDAKQNAEILSDDPNSGAVDADDLEVQYDPDTESQVVAEEPKIITIGRTRRRRELRAMQNPSSGS